MAQEVAKARQVREYDSDRRKRCLALAMKPFLEDGSAAAAEALARASEEYQKSMKQLGNELVAAEKVIADYEATKIQWESARSLLAMQRDMTRNL